jgi:two-component system chemotaxis sensor kinase CheA
MPNQNPAAVGSLQEIVGQFSLELAFCQPGKDNGLLPLNNFLMQLEEAVQKLESPLELGRAVKLARQRIDQIFDATAAFAVVDIAWLGAWQTWMQQALDCWRDDAPWPEWPRDWAVSQGQIVPSARKGGEKLSPAPAEAGNDDQVPLVLNLDADRELLSEFINESQEHLQNIENGVLVLEEDPADADTLNSIFRAFHTFKGGSGFLNLTQIKNLAHELESLLDAARQQKLTIHSPIIDVILEGGDTLKQFVTKISAQLNAQDQQPIIVPTSALIAKVKAILADPSAPIVAVPKAAPAAKLPPADNVVIVEPHELEAEAIKPTESVKTPATAAGFVKVDTQKLDALIDLVGELVISESMVVQDPELRALPSRHLARNLAQLRRITSELQRTAMSLRMVPIRSTFQKMNRLVRDLAAKQGKQVQLIFNGEDTELDRNIVEEISDPLIHMIRNAADHGVETPAARIAKGKPAQGTIQLRAFHRGGNIVIQIQDDGNGLNKDKLLAKAREKGIVKPNQNLSDKEIYELIFAAGFSTAEKITDISGRGVGMDVVRRNIEKLRGKVDIDTVLGGGTTFTIYLPLTLAIIDGMIVSVGGERYIIPTLSVRESFRPKTEMLSTVHERGEMVNVRGRLCPLLRLYQYFGQETKITNPADGIVVVVESGEQTRCLMVDELIGKQEVVIKSLGGALKKNAALAGGAVMGDGRVGLILNVDSLVKLAPQPGADAGVN